MSHLIQIAESEVSFPCESDQSILDAALKAGVQIPYSCKKGVCGNCAAHIEKGEFQRMLIWPDAKLTGQELLCQCRPQSDMVVKPPQWHQSAPAETKRVQVKVYRNVAATPDVSLLHLRLPAGQRVKFRAGQYLNIVLPQVGNVAVTPWPTRPTKVMPSNCMLDMWRGDVSAIWHAN